jgi:S-adenosylmethionine:tRNA ribosyltransferase-isomerase
VFNSSRTLPASLIGHDLKSGIEIEARLAEHLPDDSYLVLLLNNGHHKEPFQNGTSFRGMRIDFGHRLTCTVFLQDGQNPRLLKVRFSQSGPELTNLIYQLGKPIRYEHVPVPWKIDYYQNVYAEKPGSSEMPSAGRAFTWKMILDLKSRGLETTSILLHTGLSSYMDDGFDAGHSVSEEEYLIDPNSARMINEAFERKSDHRDWKSCTSFRICVSK